MASLHSLLSALQSQISSVTGGLTSSAGPALNVRIGLDWPPLRVLQQNVRGAGALVTVFDRKMSRNTTRWANIPLSMSVTEATLVSSVGQAVFNGGTAVSISLSGSITPGDAVSCVVTNMNVFATTGTPVWAVIVSVVAGDTLLTVATRLAAAINADPILSRWVSAAAMSGSAPILTDGSGEGLYTDGGGGALLSDGSLASVMLTSLLGSLPPNLQGEGGFDLELDGGGGSLLIDQPAPVGAPLSVQSYTGNGGSRIVEIGRRSRELQVVVWASSVEDRDTVGNVIEQLISSIETYWGSYGAGLTLSDGSSARIEMRNDYQLDENTPADTYRRDFLLTADYPVTTVDALYAVLAVVPQYQLGYI